MSNKIYNQEKLYGNSYALNIFDGTKVGSIILFSGDDVPSGFLECNGSDISRTDYKALFDAIGTKFGDGDGSTTFTLPNISDVTDPKIHYLIKWNVEGSMMNYATTESSGFVRFATDEEAQYSVREDLAINARQLKLAVPKSDLRERVYGTDENGRQTLYDAKEMVSKIIDLTPDTTGTLSAEELNMIKTNKNNVLRRNNIIFYYTSILDGKMRYSTVNKYTDGNDYLYTVLVDEASGEWEFSYKEVIEKYIPDVPFTNLTMPAGLSSDPSYYWVKNNMVHITINGIKASSTGEYTIPLPAELCLPSDRQIIAPANSFNDTNVNGFLRVIGSGIRYKCLRANQPCWGTISYML